MKRVTIGYGFWWECTLQIDETVFTEEIAKSLLEFFSWDWDKEADDLRIEYCKKIAQKILPLSSHYSELGILNWFSDAEGFPPLDGSSGIKLIDFDEFQFDEEFEIKQS